MKIRHVSIANTYYGRRSSRRAAAACSVICLCIAGAARADGDALLDAFTDGHATIEERARLELVDQAEKGGASAFTLRSLLGFTTAPIDGLSATLQFINVADLNSSYNSGVNGKTKYATISDPSATNVNQAYASYTGVPDTTFTVGRQIINLDDTRFVGNVDFRQNMQTFDALSAVSTPIQDVKLSASYIWGIKDILNRHLPTRIFLAEAYWMPLTEFQIEGFGYWYGNEADSVIAGAAGCGLVGAQACNSVTYGVRAHGAFALPSDFKFDYKTTYAKQSAFDGGSDLIDADYVQARGKLTWTAFNAGVEYMLMGSNGNGTYGFQTPLATKHAFNGWAEMFLTTPPEGLQSVDYFAGATAYDTTFVVKYYQFRSDYKGVPYGDEWDLSLTYKLSEQIQGGVEYADYHANGFGASTQAGWLFAKLTY